MRKLIVLSALFLCGSAAMVAQTTTMNQQSTYGANSTTYDMGGATFGLGVKGGVNFASFSGDGYNAFDHGGLTSFNAGLLAEFPVAYNFSIQPEVQYSGQGFEFQNTGNGNITLELGYINVPVLAKYYVADGFYVEAGPQLGINVRSKVKNNFNVESTADASTITNIDSGNFNDLEFGLGVGVGYKLPSGFFVDARYNFGLTDVYDNNNMPVNLDAKNSVFQVGIGFMFL